MGTVTRDSLPMSSALRTVRDMLAEDKPFEHIEAVIEDDCEMDEQEKSVLWLFALFEGCSTDLARELGRVGAADSSSSYRPSEVRV